MNEEIIPLTGLRGRIARRMVESVTTKPAVTLHATASADQLWASLTRLRERDGSVTLNDIILSTVAYALRTYPRMNGRIDATGVHLSPVINIGFACSVPDGLVVPVIKNADTKSVWQLAEERRDLTARARAGKLKPWELMDGTFSVTNLGSLGVDYFTPIINPPEIGILGLGAVRETVTWDDRDGTAKPVRVIGLSLSFDHAAIDGREAAEFLQRLVALFASHPQSLLEIPSGGPPEGG